MLALGPFVSQKFPMFIAKLSPDDLAIIGGLIKAGTVTPVIERRYTLRETPEAMRYLEGGHVRGKVVVTVE
jgi:NADPH:quinone reductase-like Zn-dependent oxidoreductase